MCRQTLLYTSVHPPYCRHSTLTFPCATHSPPFYCPPTPIVQIQGYITVSRTYCKGFGVYRDWNIVHIGRKIIRDGRGIRFATVTAILNDTIFSDFALTPSPPTQMSFKFSYQSFKLGQILIQFGAKFSQLGLEFVQLIEFWFNLGKIRSNPIKLAQVGFVFMLILQGKGRGRGSMVQGKGRWRGGAGKWEDGVGGTTMAGWWWGWGVYSEKFGQFPNLIFSFFLLFFCFLLFSGFVFYFFFNSVFLFFVLYFILVFSFKFYLKNQL